MNIAKINPSFLYDGNIMLEIFISGCKHKCKGCYNPELWNFNYGNKKSWEDIIKAIDNKFDWIDGIVLTGGDPLWNKKEVLRLLEQIKKRKRFNDIKIWLYTGFTREEIKKDKEMETIFNICDVIITDRYTNKLPRTDLTGSSNQRIWKN